MYNKKMDDIFIELDSNSNGLSESEVAKRINQNGLNQLPHKKIDNFFIIMLKQLKNPLIILLIVAALFSFIVDEKIDAFAILLIILVDLLLGTFQEWNAAKKAESLANLIRVKLRVLRGEEIEIDSEQLVVGDIVLLEPGNKVSADMRLFETENLTIDEAVLTGESIASLKNSDVIEENVTLSLRHNMVYAGTSVITGRGKAIVIATGLDTEIGKIADQVNNTPDTKSPLTIRMEKFSRQISLLVIIIAAILTILLIVKNTPYAEIFLSVVALSVSAMPEGLTLALTMALTVGSNRMAKNKVIVKKLNSVESLGSCTVIASDKTGTLTLNEQTVKKIVLPDNNEYEITGIGYNDDGEVKPLKNALLESALMIGKLGVINNEADLQLKENDWITMGDSIDVAFLSLGYKLNIDISDITIIDIIHYESEKKYSAVFYEEDGDYLCTAKGSVEKILSCCNKMLVCNKAVSLKKEDILLQNEKLAKEGYRIIAIANNKVNKKDNYDEIDVKELCFMGLVAFIDPIRNEAKASIEECRKAGIKVVMITGDHPLTATNIANQLGIIKSDKEVVTGEIIQEYLNKGETEFDEFIKNKTVFTRVTPHDKLAIVESYKRQGEFIAVTGDGVNDASAIKAANIGIAMGSGTDVAKETASMIIIDDNFKSIVAGIKEGRTAYSNIRKVSYLLLSCGLAEVLFFILSIIFNLPMPLVAIQLLWLNIVTDGLQDFALSFEKSETGIMEEKPRNTKESIFDKTLLSETLIGGLVMGFIVFGVWYYLMKQNVDIVLSRSYIMLLMVFLQNVHVFNCRSEKNSTFKISIKKNPLVVFSVISALLLQIVFMEIPTLANFLKIMAIPINHIFILFLLALIILVVMEIYKKFKYRKKQI